MLCPSTRKLLLTLPISVSKSDFLHDAFLELDPSSTKITMSFTPPEDVDTPFNRFQARGRREGNQSQIEKGGEVFRLESVGTLGSTEVGLFFFGFCLLAVSLLRLRRTYRWITRTIEMY